MKTMLLAAAALSLGIGSAYAGDSEGASGTAGGPGHEGDLAVESRVHAQFQHGATGAA